MEQKMSMASAIWGAAVEKLRSQSEALYRQWFSKMTPLSVNDSLLVIGGPDDFFCDMVNDNYGDLMTAALEDINGSSYTFRLTGGYPAAVEEETLRPHALPPADVKAAPSSVPAAAPAEKRVRQGAHNYKFENFVIGDNNRHAFAAASAVADAPGVIYNPLFIYGTNGVGKTHLLQAIASEIREKHPALVVRSVTCDEILNDYYEVLGKRRGFSEFRNSLCEADVLLIDDIHRLSKKTMMQEEFFNVFNLLYRNNKQIVLTSDRQPCEISDLDKRLSSRFEQGMTCEIGMLEYEERLVTLRMWRENSLTKPALPDLYLDFLASNIASNVRRLKGCFLRLSAYVQMSGCDDMTIQKAETLLHAQLAEESASRDICPETIQKAVATHFGISVPDIIGTRRTRQTAEPRMIAMYLCRELTKLSSNEIGDAFGRTHANVLHAAKTIAARCGSDEDMRRSINQLKRQLQKL